MIKSNLRITVIKYVITLLTVVSVTGCSQSGSTFKSDTAVLSEVQEAISPTASIVKSFPINLWWISPDGFNIINDNSPGIEVQLPGCVNDDSSYSRWKANAKKVISAVDAVMSANKFKVENLINSSSGLTDTKFYDFIKAYYRDGTKAVLSISPDCDSTLPSDNPVMYYSASFSYTNSYQKNYDKQSPFLKDLNLKDVIVHVQKSEGEFRLLAINYRRSGHATIVKRTNGKWVELWSGQDLISCVVRNSKKIPISIAGACY